MSYVPSFFVIYLAFAGLVGWTLAIRNRLGDTRTAAAVRLVPWSVGAAVTFGLILAASGMVFTDGVNLTDAAATSIILGRFGALGAVGIGACVLGWGTVMWLVQRRRVS